ELRLHAAFELKALAEIRNDGLGLVCRQSRRLGLSTDQAVQAGLMMLHKRLLDEAPLGEESFSLLGSSAACGGRVEQSEAQLASAWAEARPSSFLSFTARLGCTSCELEAVSNFVNKGGLERSEEAHAFAALAEVRCAAQGQEAAEWSPTDSE
ncbi:unnamed protein product, partial [Polarella glacialis]